MKSVKQNKFLAFLRRVFNFRYWIDYDRIRAFFYYMLQFFKKLFVPNRNAPPSSNESFQKAVEKMNLTEEGLLARQKSLFRLSIFMLILAVLLFSYTLYHLVSGTWPAVFLSASVSCIALALAFRYHFFYFQIKNRKLGCSLSEWFAQTISDGRS